MKQLIDYYINYISNLHSLHETTRKLSQLQTLLLEEVSKNIFFWNRHWNRILLHYYVTKIVK